MNNQQAEYDFDMQCGEWFQVYGIDLKHTHNEIRCKKCGEVPGLMDIDSWGRHPSECYFSCCGKQTNHELSAEDALKKWKEINK
jgi:hypothetical protein